MRFPDVPIIHRHGMQKPDSFEGSGFFCCATDASEIFRDGAEQQAEIAVYNLVPLPFRSDSLREPIAKNLTDREKAAIIYIKRHSPFSVSFV